MMRILKKVCAAILSLAMVLTLMPGIQVRAENVFSNIDVNVEGEIIAQKATLTMDTYQYSSYDEDNAYVVMEKGERDGAWSNYYEFIDNGYDVIYMYNTHILGMLTTTVDEDYFDGKLTVPVPEGYAASTAKRIYMYVMDAGEGLTINEKIPVTASTATTITIPIKFYNHVGYNDSANIYTSNFMNELFVEFQKEIDINTLNPTLAVNSFEHTGQPITPDVTINGLTKDVDYTLEYSNNVAVGTATVKVVGKGRYVGSVSLNFEIKKTIAAGVKIEDSEKNAEYKVISVKDGETTVEYEKSEKKDAKKINIPETVTLPDGSTAKVTAVAAGALKGNKTVTNVTIGKNITSIGGNAFKGCSKLNKITIKSTKIKKIGKNAFKGIKKGATIKVPKSKKEAYTKLLKKAKLPAGVKIK
ncbi:leucine-rich repeat protein [Butyrivibrio sp. VCD2006]|uniref:leucine-rich repeat protein n=1 Tax=Butyrivibrio sp. VCD2006 TaxID=1280664 RepID=UPI00042346F7|nr:leucine-rich repeat protein [Butyrivibrio sp. VCD2006]